MHIELGGGGGGSCLLQIRINSLLHVAVVHPQVHRQYFLTSLCLVNSAAYAQWRVDLFEFCTAPKSTAYISGIRSHRRIQW